ncbi:MAG: hypothetical protein WCX31_22155 [Salinivirgaceae bacterium]|jgi:hypothetical protein
MDKKKVTITLFLLSCIIALVVLIRLNYQAYSLLKNSVSSELMPAKFQLLQKQISTVNIAFFIPMLLLSLFWYYLTNSRTLILISNILYITVTIFVTYTLNREFNELHNAKATETVGFWLFALIGIFSILGSVLVSVIGYITVRNLNNRINPIPKKGRNKFSR